MFTKYISGMSDNATEALFALALVLIGLLVTSTIMML
jgi:hypothetical protein